MYSFYMSINIIIFILLLLGTYVPIHLSINLSTYFFFDQCISTYLSRYLYTYLTTYTSICLSICLSIHVILNLCYFCCCFLFVFCNEVNQCFSYLINIIVNHSYHAIVAFMRIKLSQICKIFQYMIFQYSFWCTYTILTNKFEVHA